MGVYPADLFHYFGLVFQGLFMHWIVFFISVLAMKRGTGYLLSRLVHHPASKNELSSSPDQMCQHGGVSDVPCFSLHNT